MLMLKRKWKTGRKERLIKLIRGVKSPRREVRRRMTIGSEFDKTELSIRVEQRMVPIHDPMAAWDLFDPGVNQLSDVLEGSKRYGLEDKAKSAMGETYFFPVGN
jgi:hypothetical protein